VCNNSDTTHPDALSAAPSAHARRETGISPAAAGFTNKVKAEELNKQRAVG